MTDSEIIKALECCIESDSCSKCPFANIADIRNCTSELSKNALDLINRLQAENERLRATIDSFTDIGKLYSEIKAEAYKELSIRNSSLEYALECIVWYDGHYEWLEEFAKELDAASGIYQNPLPVKEWHTEQHTIWMLLVGMFGDWGTSIRGGWIEKTKECADYIRKLCRRAKDEDDEDGDDMLKTAQEYLDCIKKGFCEEDNQ